MTPFGQRIEPLSALMYDPAKAGALSDLIAPPYDLIDAARQDALYARSPYNVIRLELNRDADPYASASATLDQWRGDGILSYHLPPAIFFYTQRFEVAGKPLSRNGLIARIRLEPFSSGRVLPHEKTFPKAKEDRLKLLTATRTNVSPIFGLYPADTGLRDLTAEVAKRAPMLRAKDDLGIENELRLISAPQEIAAIQHALADCRVLIADGHHRYETALEYQRRRRADDPSPAAIRGYDYVMMTLVAFDDPGLVILPTHRVVRSLPAGVIASFAAKAREHFTVEELHSGEALHAALVQRGRGAIGVALKGQSPYLLTLRDATVMAAIAPDLAAVVRDLDVARLHVLVFNRIFAVSAEQIRQGGDITYTIDAAGALGAVARGEGDGAFLMNPPTVHDVARVSDSGATMPEKSTYFHPKLVTGLVLNPLDDPA
ncbi:MAG: DUF1015 domain-containing protein [Candidatus Binataceae bacterium]|jgi:uncharacterized protein (DUF1015 family)